MARARRYRFLLAWAHGQVVTGYLVMILGGLVALAVTASWPAELVAWVPGEWRARLGPAAPIVVPLLAFVAGGALVLGGQLLLLLRDIHRHLARMDARVRRRVREPDGSSERQDVTSRLLPRR